MRTQQRRPGQLVLSVILLAAACQSPQSVSTSPTPIAPVTLFEVDTVSTVAPTPVRQTSGVRLAANIDLKCAEAAQPNAECLRPYSGEFVITTLNGAEVARVMTDDEGQATVDLPPGKYILGVRTEEIYPLAAPVKVNVLADRYVHISLSLDSGKQP